VARATRDAPARRRSPSWWPEGLGFDIERAGPFEGPARTRVRDARPAAGTAGRTAIIVPGSPMVPERSPLEFVALLARGDADIDLARASLVIARQEYPGLDVEAYLERLAAMGRELASRLDGAEPEPEPSSALLSGYLSGEHGFHGNTEQYHDPRNSLLSDVLDRRMGIPITLSLVWMEVGRRAGLRVDGVGLPGHFVVRVGGQKGVLLDPFHGGAPLSLEDCQRRLDRIFGGRVRLGPRMLEAWDGRSILARVLRNLKALYVKAGDWGRGLGVAEMLVPLCPDNPGERRDRGLLYAAMDCYRLAADDLESYLVRAPQAADAADLGARVRELRARAARVN
jgi:regulator of sirC expression with transglutaminase-like and TPR domain